MIPQPTLRTGLSPVLLIHGDDDRNVPFQQTTDLVEKLCAQSVAFEELIIPDEIHDLLRWSETCGAHLARQMAQGLAQRAHENPKSIHKLHLFLL